MATKAEKQELIDVLKFTPTRVRLLIQGYGGEAYASRVDRKIYDYFASQKIDMEEYAGDWDGIFNDHVPQDMRPFSPGSPYDCDGLFHASGAELSDLNSITVEEMDSNKMLWDYNLGYSNLEDAGVTVNQCGGEDLDDLDEDEVVFWGGQGEKGCFFDAEFVLKAPFDPKKLTVGYENCDGWYIVNFVEYDGEELDGSGGYSTTGKWNENKWILCNGNDVYDSVSLDDREDEGLEWGTVATSSEPAIPPMPELPMTDWYDVSIKPVRKGEYEVKNTNTPVWPFPATFRATWSGRTWKDSDGDKVENVIAWRGLAVDPNQLVTIECECVQCEWAGPIDDTHDVDGEMCCPECGEPVELK